MPFCFPAARQAPSDETQNRAIGFCAAIWRPAEGTHEILAFLYLSTK